MTRLNSRTTATVGRAVSRLAVALMLGSAGTAAADAAEPDPCAGRWVRSLGGSHAVLRPALRDVADLQRKLPQLEASIRAAVARDGSLSPAVADAILAAIRDGSGIGTRMLGRQEEVRWMAYQPQRGTIDLIAPPCIRLGRDYDAFEFTVRVDEPVPVAPADAVCRITATRNCEHENPTVTLDLDGSAQDPRVTLSAGGPASDVSGKGSLWSVPDPAPYDADLSFTLRAHGTAPAARVARVHRFLMPRICANLAYLGEGEPIRIADAGPPATCEQSVELAQCKPWAEVAELAVESSEVGREVKITIAGGGVGSASRLEITGPAGAPPFVLENPAGEVTYVPEVANCGDEKYRVRFETRNAAGDTAEATAEFSVTPHDWIARGFVFALTPTGDEQERTITLPTGAAREVFEVDDGYGLGFALEHLPNPANPRWGVEGALHFGRAKTEYELSQGSLSGEDGHNANFYALTVGPNLHLLKCKRADLYLGAFAGYGGFADPNYWALDHHFAATFDGKFVWGAQLGLDVPVSATSPWGVHAGLRWFDLSQDTDAGSLAVDPLTVEAGFSYRF